MQFNPLVPELEVLDFQKSIAFYTQVLGFTIEYQRKEEFDFSTKGTLRIYNITKAYMKSCYCVARRSCYASENSIL